tara:strand:+ start:32702 stop:33526 length:825 start_codon:yes stop_codon:yes gene_type:complete
MSKSLIEKNAKRRMEFLLEYQSHSDEWDCPYDEMEYFLLKRLTQPVFNSEIEEFYENPLLALDSFNIKRFLEEITKDVVEKKSTNISDIENDLERMFKAEVLYQIEDDYWDSFDLGRFEKRDVLLQALVYFFRYSIKKDYDPKIYPYTAIFREVEKDSNDSLPNKNAQGWIRSYVLNQREEEIHQSFSYWDGKKFKNSETKPISENFEIVAWREIVDRDKEDFIIFKSKISQLNEYLRHAFSDKAIDSNLEPEYTDISWGEEFDSLKRYKEQEQ